MEKLDKIQNSSDLYRKYSKKEMPVEIVEYLQE